MLNLLQGAKAVNIMMSLRAVQIVMLQSLTLLPRVTDISVFYGVPKMVQTENKKMSEAHERFIAESLNGKTTIASGALWMAKSDVVTSLYQIECKATRKNYYILKSKIVEKIRGEALKSGRIPLLAIRCSLGDFMLFRVYDFFTEVTETSLKCSSSLKITQDIFEGLFEGFREIDVNGNVRVCLFDDQAQKGVIGDYQEIAADEDLKAKEEDGEIIETVGGKEVIRLKYRNITTCPDEFYPTAPETENPTPGN